MLDHLHVLDTRLEQVTRLMADRDPRFRQLDVPKIAVPDFESEAQAPPDQAKRMGQP
jgi:hypothetical protein